MAERKLGTTMAGFAAVGAALCAADGYLINPTVAGGLAGALIGALIGVGVVLLAWRPLPQDATTQPVHDVKHPNYFAIWAVLFVLTMVEVGVAFVALSKTLIIVVLVALAVWKALLVALYYMHLKFEPKRLWVLAASPLPLAVILVVAVLTERF